MGQNAETECAGIIELSEQNYTYDDFIIEQIPDNMRIEKNLFQLLKPQFVSKASSFLGLNELVRQVYVGQTQFMFLSSNKIEIVCKLRPIDILMQQLVSNNKQELKLFADYYGNSECCCMLIEILTNQNMEYIKDSSKKLIKGKPSDHTLKDAQEFFLQIGNSQSQECLPDQSNLFKMDSIGQYLSSDRKKQKAKLEGLLLYFQRMMRPIWNANIIQPLDSSKLTSNYECFTKEQLSIIRQKVFELKKFVHTHQNYLQLPQIIENGHSTENKIFTLNELDENQAFEQKLIESINIMLNRIMQTIDLFVYIFEKKLVRPFILNINEQDANLLHRLKFSEIFKQDEEADIIIRLWLNNILKFSQNFDQESKYFQDKFSLFYDLNDSLQSKAFAILNQCLELNKLSNNQEKAKEKSNKIMNLMQQAYQKLEQIQAQTSSKELDFLYNQYVIPLKSFIQFANMIKIKIQNAQKLLRNDVDIMQDSCSFQKLINEDIKQYIELLNQRLIVMMKELLKPDELVKLSETGSYIDLYEEQYGTFKYLTYEEKVELFKQMLTIISSIQDQDLHMQIFKQLIQYKLIDFILIFNSQYFEIAIQSYLSDQNFKYLHKLKFRYFKNQGKYFHAFLAANNLTFEDQSQLKTEKQDLEQIITLEDRIMYLNFAIENLEQILKQHTNQQQNYWTEINIDQKQCFQLLRDKKNSLEILKIQINIQNKIKSIDNKQQQEILNINDLNNWIISLDRKVYTVDELNQIYIKPLNFYDIQLILYSLVDENVSQNTIYQIHQNMIEYTYQKYIPLGYDNWIIQVKEQLTNLHFYFQNFEAKYIPIKELIVLIEKYNLREFNIIKKVSLRKMGFDINQKLYWVQSFFCDDLKQNYHSVFEIYKTLLIQNGCIQYVSNWDSSQTQNSRQSFYLINAMVNLLIQWLQNLYVNINRIQSNEAFQQFDSKNIKDFYENFDSIYQCINLCSQSLSEMEENLIIDKSHSCLSQYLQKDLIIQLLNCKHQIFKEKQMKFNIKNQNLIISDIPQKNYWQSTQSYNESLIYKFQK